MPLSTFADPTVAIEPPPQSADFDYSMAKQILGNPFGLGYVDSSAITTSSPIEPASTSWTDVFKSAGQSFIKEFADAAAGKVTGYNPSDPTQRASFLASQAAQQKAQQQQLLLIVGGVGVAVVLGALVMGRRRRK
jgi:hypothetical protein